MKTVKVWLSDSVLRNILQDTKDFPHLNEVTSEKGVSEVVPNDDD